MNVATARSVARFIVVGFANTATGLAVIYALKGIGSAGDATANAVGYAVGLLISFALNRSWTFNYTGENWQAFVRFATVVLVGYGINLATVLSAIGRYHLNSYLAQALGVVPYAAFTYLGCRYFAFAPRSDGSRNGTL